MRPARRVLSGLSLLPLAPLALAAAAGCSSAKDAAPIPVSVDTTPLGYVAHVGESGASSAFDLDVQTQGIGHHAHVHWVGGDITVDAYVAQVGIFPDGVSFGYEGTISSATGSEDFTVDPRGTADTAHYAVQGGPGELVVTEKASGAVLSIASTNGVPVLPWDDSPDVAAAFASSGDDDDSSADAGTGAGVTPQRSTRALDETSTAASRVRFASSATPCVAASSQGTTNPQVALNQSPVTVGSGLLTTASAGSLGVDALVSPGGPITSGSGQQLASSGGCGDAMTQPVCSADKVQAGTCLVASAQTQCRLQGVASAMTSCAVAALATTGYCAAGTAVTTLGTGEILCLAPGGASLVCGIAAILSLGVANLVCNGSTRQVKSYDPTSCDEETKNGMEEIKGNMCGQAAASGGCNPFEMNGAKPTCDVVQTALSRWSLCATWRKKIMDKCFDGTADDGHKQQYNDAVTATNTCKEVYNKLQCGLVTPVM
jgi:hypothetical protein